jgi:RHS repeat-associated protein
VYSPSRTKLALMNGSSLVKAFVPLPGGAQAVYNSSGLQYYRHPDWLGSSRLATTSSRTLYYSGAYAPFGENYAQSGTQDLSFTGQNQDTVPSSAGGAGGLYDFLYREHSPVQGRWLSPDPAGLAAAQPSDPQTWNRYAYVGNRALTGTDSNGLFGQGPLCGWDIPCPGPCDPDVDPDCWGPGPIDPYPPPGGPIPINPPGLPNRPYQRTGGVWPGNETLGLPSVPNTSPLDLGNLLSFLPGLSCGGLGGGSAFGFVQVTTVPSGDPCQIPVLTIILATEAVAGDSSGQDKQKSPPSCDPKTLPGPGFNDWCKARGWVTVAGFDCTGDNSCCAIAISTFKSKCLARNDWYDKKAGVLRYEPIDKSTYLTPDVLCCKKW